ncbi:DUF3047 domain-containing protein [Mangrovicoccus sp. HB161399]|uniref:DUF3047 domain-containing protein n=1 Tax=Mangrovicoccus sp. HB161399 TaxID=2720392 RepID=UPI0020A63263|nr:DUF3047 domain-containing protein [Mangrovicoccus sp. HB161399]
MKMDKTALPCPAFDASAAGRPIRRRRLLSAAAAAAAWAVLPVSVGAQSAIQIRFGDGWQRLDFPGLKPTRYEFGGTALSIAGDASSSLIYLAAPESARTASRASWSWSVSRSVPPTDLGRKGGDDRNISLYFVFMDAASAERLGPGTPPQRLLRNRSARVLLYVWGGSHPPGSRLPSPYLRGRGVTIVLRPAGAGQAIEQVDLAGDHAAAFGTVPERLVGLAVSADSDDTGTALRARLSVLSLS